jgi:GDPmannose 4,6-dehydratase
MGVKKTRRVALITGVTGQDGAHLAKCLLEDDWQVYGGFRRGASNKTWRMDALGITRGVELIECQLNEPLHLIEILQSVRPDHIYNLAGESFVADSFKYPGVTLEVNAQGTLNMLDAVRLVSPESRLFSASSSEIYGVSETGQPCNEETHCLPTNPYGISKLAARSLVSLYRDYYDLFACSGILFNHEGPLRGREYVTRKITFNIARLRVRGGSPIELGDMNAARDWGAASDYVRGMYYMLRHKNPRDMVISSGSLTTVRDFLRIAALAANFDPVFEGEGIHETCTDRRSGLCLAHVSKKYFRQRDTTPLVGDSSLIETLTGWRRQVSLDSMITEMINVDIMRWESGLTNV